VNWFLTVYTSYDMFLLKELLFGSYNDYISVVIFSGTNFLNRS